MFVRKSTLSLRIDFSFAGSCRSYTASFCFEVLTLSAYKRSNDHAHHRSLPTSGAGDSIRGSMYTKIRRAGWYTDCYTSYHNAKVLLHITKTCILVVADSP
eukprot:747314-Hanusia_phi.AAC.8